MPFLPHSTTSTIRPSIGVARFASREISNPKVAEVNTPSFPPNERQALRHAK